MRAAAVTPTWKALDAACRLRHQFVGADGYGIAYGSHPAGTATTTSDLDLVLITADPLPTGRLEELVEAVCRLHKDHGLALDTEVDHAVKVHASCADVTAAVSLRCFSVSDNGRLKVPPVVVEPWFLNSELFRRRLLLNALTSPHVFLGGNVRLYSEHRHLAERGLALLALSLHPDTVVTLADAARALTEEPCGGAGGKDYLGYLPDSRLHSALACGLATLAAEGILRDLDGTRFEHDPAGVRAAIVRLRAHSAAARPEGGA